MAKPQRRVTARNKARSGYRWQLAAVGIVVAVVAILVRFFDTELALLLGTRSRLGIDRLAQAMGLVAAGAGFVGLWRGEAFARCGAAIVLGAVALFLDLFVFTAFVALLVAAGIVLYRLADRR